MNLRLSFGFNLCVYNVNFNDSEINQFVDCLKENCTFSFPSKVGSQFLYPQSAHVAIS